MWSMSDFYIRDWWHIAGEQSTDTLLVRGGRHPVAIRVSHPDSADLRRLVDEANRGIRATEGTAPPAQSE
jgi:hypothetical protein